MPRRPNTRPTSIYWLFDVRPETIAAGWSDGQPFYCGKTVNSPGKRLVSHRSTAATRGDAGARIIECGKFIRTQTMEVVPVDGDWCARETHWIATGRLFYPGCFLNVSNGGEGAPGYIHTNKARAKIGAAARNRSPETLAKISAGSAGNLHRLGQNHSVEVRAKMSAAHSGKKKSDKHRASLSEMARRRSPETLARIGNALKGNTNAKGKKKSADTIAKRTATRKANRIAVILALSN